MQKAIFEIKTVKNKSIEEAIQKAQKDLSKFFGLSFSLPRVFLVDSQEQMNVLYQRDLGENSVGSCDGENIFILKGLLKENPDRFLKVLKHEYVHMVSREFCDVYRIKPTWIKEGIACYLAEQDMKIPSRKTALKISSSYSWCYIGIHNVGCFWVKNLINIYGKSKFLKLLRSLRKMDCFKEFKVVFKSIYKIEFNSKELGQIYDKIVKI